MSLGLPQPPDLSPEHVRAMRANLHAIRDNWGWVLAFGILLVVVGFMAIAAPLVATVTTVTVIGVFALMGAGAEFVNVFRTRGWEGVVLHLLTGVLYLIFGFLAVAHPVKTAAVFTLLLAGIFLVSGVFRIVIATAVRFHNWGWELAGGLLNVVLGMLIWQDLPESSLWVIGLFVGIDMVFSGATWINLALALKSLKKLAEGSPPA